jgi:hypothetical protein
MYYAGRTKTELTMWNRIKPVAMVMGVALAVSFATAFLGAGETLAASCTKEGNWRSEGRWARIYARDKDPDLTWSYKDTALPESYTKIDRYKINDAYTGIDTKKYKFTSSNKTLTCTVKIERKQPRGTPRIKFLSATCTGYTYKCSRNYVVAEDTMDVKFSIGE